MSDMGINTFGEILTFLRKQSHMSQQALANKLDVHRNTISKWERGACLPDSKTIVLELARQLRLDATDARRLLEASLTAISPYWHMPYQRNPFFTGRDSVLDQLYRALNQEHTAVLSQTYALSGLGGIGKTQTAIEYAYRYANDYAAVFWVGAETYESVVASFLAIAAVLNLPEKQEQEQSRVMAVVIRWLNSHSEWLLILDNVEDLELVKNVLPAARCGSLLFTSRRQALGLSAQTLDLEQMTPEEGMRFLLHRARLLDLTATMDSLSAMDTALAREITIAMDGLPLALDQAGAYIEATQCSLADYLSLIRSSHIRLLDERDAHADHPLSVTKTFTLAFEQLERSNPAAADILTVCAFLAPEAIPETVFTEGAAYLGPTLETLADPFQFHGAIKALLTYSLLQRNAATQTVTIHRLVQAVLKERMEDATQRIWIVRIIQVIAQLFPSDEDVQVDYWQNCERLLPHALISIAYGEQWGEDTLLYMILISRVALYLKKRARYAEAEPLYKRALDIGEQAHNTEHLVVAEVLYGLAELYTDRGEYELAMPLFQHAIQRGELALGPEHPQIASYLTGLGGVYFEQDKHELAEHLYQRALYIAEKTLNPEHPQITKSLNSLGILYGSQGKYELAEPLFQRTLQIRERALGPEHPQICNPLNNLGMVYFCQAKYNLAEALHQRVLRIRERILGSKHPQLISTLSNLGDVYFEQGKYELAEALNQRALRISENALGPKHYQVGNKLSCLAEIYYAQDKYELAEASYQQALMIIEQAVGLEHSYLVHPLTGLAVLLSKQGRYEQAEPLFRRALAIYQQRLNAEHPQLAKTLYHFAHFHQAQQKNEEALLLYKQALTIREQNIGLLHPKTIETRTAYVELLRKMGRVKEAEAVEARVPVEGTSFGESSSPIIDVHS